LTGNSAQVAISGACAYIVSRSIVSRSKAECATRSESVDFTEPVVLVLTSLADGPKHGYALAKDIESFSGVKLGPGTLYGALSRLERRGWIEALPADSRRRPYQITAPGADGLARHLTAVQQVAATGLRRLAIRPA
jgi:DNA-binding MarR family transcriptional regulator